MSIEQHKLIVKALKQIRPEAEWVLRGFNYEGLEWLDSNQTKPTKEEIDNAIANPFSEPELSVSEKLASVGLDFEELKAAILGGGN